MPLFTRKFSVPKFPARKAASMTNLSQLDATTRSQEFSLDFGPVRTRLSGRDLVFRDGSWIIGMYCPYYPRPSIFSDSELAQKFIHSSLFARWQNVHVSLKSAIEDHLLLALSDRCDRDGLQIQDKVKIIGNGIFYHFSLVRGGTSVKASNLKAESQWRTRFWRFSFFTERKVLVIGTRERLIAFRSI